MSACKLVSFMVPDGPPYYVAGSCHGVSQCLTHHWTIEGLISADMLCPIGRIETATEVAIARIKEAQSV